MNFILRDTMGILHTGMCSDSRVTIWPKLPMAGTVPECKNALWCTEALFSTLAWRCDFLRINDKF
nr:MAG TPA: hypothetical protein [Caudoviricetes sp.]